MIKILAFILSISLAFAESEDSLIPVEIKKRDSENIEANIGELTEEGKELGIDSMTLKGIQSVEQIEGNRNRVKILWQKVKLNDTEKELSEPLVSEVEIEGNIREGDSFSAKGNARNLIKVFDELKQVIFNTEGDGKEQQDKDIEDILESDSANFISSGRNSGGDYGVDETVSTNTDPLAVNYEVVEDQEIVTSDGCSKRVDIANMQINIQKRTLKAGEEVSPCADSDEIYQLTRDYKNCSEFVDLETEKVFKRYRVVYSNGVDDGVVQIEACQIDKKEFAELTRDYESCGLKHDAAEDKSFARYRLTYQINEWPQIFQDCQEDKDRDFEHFKDSSTCKPTITDKEVVFFERRAIKRGGKTEFLSECEPLKNTHKIYDEICKKSRYEHDFQGGQSFVNKDYFYFKNGNRVNISSCIKSDVILPHKYDTSVCEVIHDDEKRQSQLYVKTFIEDSAVEGGKVFISDCIKSGAAISYTNISDRWNIVSSKQENIVSIPAGKERVAVKAHLEGVGYLDHIWMINTMRIMSGHIDRSWANRFRKTLCNPDDYNDPDNYLLTKTTPSQTVVSSYKNSSLSNNWISSSGKLIDKQWSDTTVSISASLEEERCMLCKEARCYYSPDNYLIKYSINSSQATCKVSTLNRHPSYRRFDGTEFIDKVTVLDTKTICGSGVKLRGEE